MPTTFTLKANTTSGAVPSAGSLAVGELAINTGDGKLYSKMANNTVIQMNSPPGSGGAQGTIVSVNFGNTWSQKAQTVVTGQSWVSTALPMTASILPPAGVDPDEMFMLDMKAIISNVVNGVGFTLTLFSEPEAINSYSVMVVGK